MILTTPNLTGLTTLLSHASRALYGLVAQSLYAGLLLLPACSSWLGQSSALYRAEELTQQGNYEQAITSYEKHIQERVEVSGKPDWENPHFYLLRIGDLQLRQEKPLDALASYEEAERQKVEPTLISDRYRAVANWYLERGDLQQGFDLLTKYRDRDSLLFDAMLDRIGRELTAKDSLKTKASSVNKGLMLP